MESHGGGWVSESGRGMGCYGGTMGVWGGNGGGGNIESFQSSETGVLEGGDSS